MEIGDLEKFVVLATTENMQLSAQQLDTSPSALSKALKRLEKSTSTALFDRIGKHISLNQQGRVLLPKAVEIVRKTQEAKALLSGQELNEVKIAGPSILLSRWASVLARSSSNIAENCQLNFDVCYEQAALNAVLNGQVDAAIITQELAPTLPKNLPKQPLGQLELVIATGANHSLAKAGSVCIKDVEASQFAVPERSPYCGEYRGTGCDGWGKGLFNRNMPVVVNDFNVLVQLLKSGLYLGYVPSFWAREHQLYIIECKEIPQNTEQVIMVSWRQSLLESLLN